jgi:sugar O-acyltransferase (sialic acid O-acetyltransferase NeuD family)
MTDSIVILGAGGFGREVLDVIEAVNSVQPTWNFLGFLDDGSPDEGVLTRRGTKLLGPTDMLGEIDAQFVIGIGSGSARARLDVLAASVGRKSATLVHPSATFGSDIEVGEGSIICAHVSLTTHIRVGRHVHINLSCTVGHDSVLEDYVTLFPGVSISGNVIVKEQTTVGSRTVVLPGLEVGARAVVGAGAVVVSAVPGGATVAGVPARTLTKTKE